MDPCTARHRNQALQGLLAMLLEPRGFPDLPLPARCNARSVRLRHDSQSESSRHAGMISRRHVAPDALVRGGRTERPPMEFAFRTIARCFALPTSPRTSAAGRVRAPAPTWHVLARADSQRACSTTTDTHSPNFTSPARTGFCKM